MALLTTADYPAIRAAIDISLDAAALPDAIIGLDLYAGAAQRAVRVRDPQAESRTGEQRAVITLAAVLWCAGLLAPALPAISRETHGNDTYQRLTRDPALLGAELITRAETEIASVVGAGSPSRAPRPAAVIRPARFTTGME